MQNQKADRIVMSGEKYKISKPEASYTRNVRVEVMNGVSVGRVANIILARPKNAYFNQKPHRKTG